MHHCCLVNVVLSLGLFPRLPAVADLFCTVGLISVLHWVILEQRADGRSLGISPDGILPDPGMH